MPALAGCAALLSSLAGAAAGAVVPVHSIGRDQGLPSTQVHDLVQAPDGAMFFAGPSGLVRYEGNRATVIRKDAGLATNGLRALAVDADGRLWIGSDVGVDRRDDDGRIAPLAGPEDLAGGVVEEIAFDPDGAAWIATTLGLFRWTATGGVTPADDPRLRDGLVTLVRRGPAGALWAASAAGGLLARRGGPWQTVVDEDASGIGMVLALAFLDDGTTVIGGARGLLALDGAGRPGAAPELAAAVGPGRVSAILADGDDLWLGVAGQLHWYRRGSGGRWRLYEIALPSSVVNRLVVDDAGNLWAATDNDGVAKISLLREVVRQAPAPCRTQVFSLAAGARDEILVGGDRCSWTMDRETLRIRRHLRGLDGTKVWDLRPDEAGALWAASERGLLRQRADRFELAFAGETILAGPTRFLLPRAGGGWWVGTVSGLAEVAAGTARERTGADGASLGYVYTLASGPGGEVWIGTIGNGLWRLMPGASSPERVGDPVFSPRGNTYSIAFDGEHRRIAVSQDDGLLVREDGRWQAVRLPTTVSVGAWSLLFDELGRLWVGGEDGLGIYQQERAQRWLRLTGATGLSGSEFTTSRSLLRDRDGRVLCGLAGGLSAVDPEALAGLPPMTEPRLLALEWSGAEPRREGRTQVVRQGPWSFNAQVFAPWFVAERGVRYRHRLLGFDSAWSPFHDGDRIHYTTLPVGRYTLEAQATSELVGDGPTATLAALRVLPPWWRSWWGIALWLGLAGLLGSGIWRWQSRRLIRRTQALEAAVAAKTAELRQAIEKLDTLAHEDVGTGLANRRAFRQEARRYESVARRHGSTFALMLLDLDDFKEVNDRWGHQAGDTVLRAVAERIRAAVRAEDLPARYGGEEFAVLVADAAGAKAGLVAERIRQDVARSPIEIDRDIEIALTVSCGIAVWQGEEDDLADLLRRADTALYAAKARGKNNVVRWRPELDGDGGPVG